MNGFVSSCSLDLKKIPGFETTEYAYLNQKIVWTGSKALTRHPRNIHSPWLPTKKVFDNKKLTKGALICKKLFEKNQLLSSSTKGLMHWLVDEEMPFPLNLCTNRFDAIKQALVNEDLEHFSISIINVIGLGNGLTPSGDDFVGGIFFALASAQLLSNQKELPRIINAVQKAANNRTNVISAALLDDLMAGSSYEALHDVVDALETLKVIQIKNACDRLLILGASSGADMLAGLLLALTITTTSKVH